MPQERSKAAGLRDGTAQQGTCLAAGAPEHHGQADTTTGMVKLELYLSAARVAPPAAFLGGASPPSSQPSFHHLRLPAEKVLLKMSCISHG